MPALTANRELMRDLNRHLVLSLIKNQGPISRADVAAQSGLAQGTVTNITRDLIEAGLVRETASGPSTGGRPPILLEIDPGGGHALGLKLMGDRTIMALVDLDGQVLQCHVEPVSEPGNLPTYLSELRTGVDAFLQTVEMKAESLVGIGVGLPGFIDHEAGICRHSALFGWHDVPLRKLLEDRLGTAVVIDNDVNTLTLYEAHFGSGKGLADFIVATIGRGVGMGAYVQGRLLRGGTGGAGELGHIPVWPDGPMCNCGNRGCLEALISDSALLAQAQALGLPVDSSEQLMGLGQAGDPQALQLYREAGMWLGRGLATLVNILNPTHIILSGEGAAAAEYLRPGLDAALKAHAFDGLAADTTFSIEPLGDELWARGAASLALDMLFGSPMYVSR